MSGHSGVLINIETCTRCDLHKQSTRHDEKKYTSVYEEIKTALENAIPSVRITRNIPPSNLRKIEGENYFFDKKLGAVVQFPKIGAFEIYCQDHLVFSKLESGMWPSAKSIVTLIKKIIEYSSRGMTVEEEIYQYQQSTTIEVNKDRKKSKKRTPEKTKEPSPNDHSQDSVIKSPLDHSRVMSAEKKTGNLTDQDNSSMNSTFYESLRFVKKETEKTTTTKIKRVFNKRPDPPSSSGHHHAHSSPKKNCPQCEAKGKNNSFNQSEYIRTPAKTKEGVISVRDDVSALCSNIYYPRLEFLNKEKQPEQLEIRKYIPNLKVKNLSAVKTFGNLRSGSENPKKKKKLKKKKRAKSKKSPEQSPSKLPFLIINEDDLQKILKKYEQQSHEDRSPSKSNWLNSTYSFNDSKYTQTEAKENQGAQTDLSLLNTNTELDKKLADNKKKNDDSAKTKSFSPLRGNYTGIQSELMIADKLSTRKEWYKNPDTKQGYLSESLLKQNLGLTRNKIIKQEITQSSLPNPEDFNKGKLNSGLDFLLWRKKKAELILKKPEGVSKEEALDTSKVSDTKQSSLGKTKVVNSEARRKLKPIHKEALKGKIEERSEDIIKKLSFEKQANKELNQNIELKSERKFEEKIIQTSIQNLIEKKHESTLEEIVFSPKNNKKLNDGGESEDLSMMMRLSSGVAKNLNMQIEAVKAQEQMSEMENSNASKSNPLGSGFLNNMKKNEEEPHVTTKSFELPKLKDKVNTSTSRYDSREDPNMNKLQNEKKGKTITPFRGAFENPETDENSENELSMVKDMNKAEQQFETKPDSSGIQEGKSPNNFDSPQIIPKKKKPSLQKAREGIEKPENMSKFATVNYPTKLEPDFQLMDIEGDHHLEIECAEAKNEEAQAENNKTDETIPEIVPEQDKQDQVAAENKDTNLNDRESRVSFDRCVSFGGDRPLNFDSNKQDNERLEELDEEDENRPQRVMFYNEGVEVEIQSDDQEYADGNHHLAEEIYVEEDPQEGSKSYEKGKENSFVSEPRIIQFRWSENFQKKKIIDNIDMRRASEATIMRLGRYDEQPENYKTTIEESDREHPAKVRTITEEEISPDNKKDYSENVQNFEKEQKNEEFEGQDYLKPTTNAELKQETEVSSICILNEIEVSGEHENALKRDLNDFLNPESMNSLKEFETGKGSENMQADPEKLSEKAPADTEYYLQVTETNKGLDPKLFEEEEGLPDFGVNKRTSQARKDANSIEKLQEAEIEPPKEETRQYEEIEVAKENPVLYDESASKGIEEATLTTKEQRGSDPMQEGKIPIENKEFELLEAELPEGERNLNCSVRKSDENVLDKAFKNDQEIDELNRQSGLLSNTKILTESLENEKKILGKGEEDPKVLDEVTDKQDEQNVKEKSARGSEQMRSSKEMILNEKYKSNSNRSIQNLNESFRRSNEERSLRGSKGKIETLSLGSRKSIKEFDKELKSEEGNKCSPDEKLRESQKSKKGSIVFQSREKSKDSQKISQEKVPQENNTSQQNVFEEVDGLGAENPLRLSAQNMEGTRENRRTSEKKPTENFESSEKGRTSENQLKSSIEKNVFPGETSNLLENISRNAQDLGSGKLRESDTKRESLIDLEATAAMSEKKLARHSIKSERSHNESPRTSLNNLNNGSKFARNSREGTGGRISGEKQAAKPPSEKELRESGKSLEVIPSSEIVNPSHNEEELRDDEKDYHLVDEFLKDIEREEVQDGGNLYGNETNFIAYEKENKPEEKDQILLIAETHETILVEGEKELLSMSGNELKKLESKENAILHESLKHEELRHSIDKVNQELELKVKDAEELDRDIKVVNEEAVQKNPEESNLMKKEEEGLNLNCIQSSAIIVEETQNAITSGLRDGETNEKHSEVKIDNVGNGLETNAIEAEKDQVYLEASLGENIKETEKVNTQLHEKHELDEYYNEENLQGLEKERNVFAHETTSEENLKENESKMNNFEDKILESIPQNNVNYEDNVKVIENILECNEINKNPQELPSETIFEGAQQSHQENEKVLFSLEEKNEENQDPNGDNLNEAECNNHEKEKGHNEEASKEVDVDNEKGLGIDNEKDGELKEIEDNKASSPAGNEAGQGDPNQVLFEEEIQIKGEEGNPYDNQPTEGQENLIRASQENMNRVSQENLNRASGEIIKRASQEGLKRASQENLIRASQENICRSSQENVHRTSRTSLENLNRASHENLKRVSQENLNRVSQENLARGSQENLNRASQENLARGSQENINIAGQENLTRASQENLTRISQEKITRGSQEIINRASAENLTRASQENLIRASQEKITRGSQEIIYRASPENLIRASQENLTRGSQEKITKGSQEIIYRASPENLTRASQENLTRASLENLNKFSQENLTRGSQENINRVSQENLTRASQENLNRVSQENLARESQENLNKASQQENLTRGSQENINRVSQENLTRASQENLNRVSQENLARASQENLNKASQQGNLTRGSQENINRASQENLTRASQENLNKVSQENLTRASQEDLNKVNQQENSARGSQENIIRVSQENLTRTSQENLNRVSQENLARASQENLNRVSHQENLTRGGSQENINRVSQENLSMASQEKIPRVSQENLTRGSQEIIYRASQENLTRASQEKLNQISQENFISQENINRASQENLARGSQEIIYRTSQENLTRASQENLNKVSQENLPRASQENLNKVSHQENLTRGSQENINRVSQENLNRASQENLNRVSQENLARASQENLNKVSQQLNLTRGSQENINRASQENVSMASLEKIPRVSQENLTIGSQEIIYKASQENLTRVSQENLDQISRGENFIRSSQENLNKVSQEKITRASQENLTRGSQEIIYIATQENLTRVSQENLNKVNQQENLTRASQENLTRASQENLNKVNQQGNLTRASQENLNRVSQENLARASQENLNKVSQQENLTRGSQEDINRASQENLSMASQEKIPRVSQENLTIGSQDIIYRASQENITRASQEKLNQISQENFIRSSQENLTRGSQENINRASQENLAGGSQDIINRASQEKIARGSQKIINISSQEDLTRVNQENLTKVSQEYIKGASQENLTRGSQENITRASQENLARGSQENIKRVSQVYSARGSQGNIKGVSQENLARGSQEKINTSQENLVIGSQEFIKRESQENLAGGSKDILNKTSSENLNRASQVNLNRASQENLNKVSQENINRYSQEKLSRASHENLIRGSQEKINRASQEKLSRASQDNITKASQENLTRVSQENIISANQENLTRASQENLTRDSQENLMRASQAKMNRASQEILTIGSDNKNRASQEILNGASQEITNRASQDNLARESIEKIAKASQENLNRASQENLTRVSQEKITRASQENINRASQENLARGSQEIIYNYSQENITRGSQQNLNNVSQENLGRGSQENINRVSQENLTRASQENSKRASQANLNRASQENLIRASQENIIRASQGILTRGSQDKNINRSSQKNLNSGSQENISRVSQENLIGVSHEQITRASQENLTRASQENLTRASQENLARAIASQENLSRASQENISRASQENLTRVDQEKINRASQENINRASQENINRACQENLSRGSGEIIFRASQENLTRASQENLNKANHQNLNRASQENLNRASQENLIPSDLIAKENNTSSGASAELIMAGISNQLNEEPNREHLGSTKELVYDTENNETNAGREEIINKNSNTLPENEENKGDEDNVNYEDEFHEVKITTECIPMRNAQTSVKFNEDGERKGEEEYMKKDEQDGDTLVENDLKEEESVKLNEGEKKEGDQENLNPEKEVVHNERLKATGDFPAESIFKKFKVNEDKKEEKKNVNTGDMFVENGDRNQNEIKMSDQDEAKPMEEQGENLQKYMEVKGDDERLNPLDEKANLDAEQVNPNEGKGNPEEEQVNSDKERVNLDEEKVNLGEEKVNPDENHFPEVQINNSEGVTVEKADMDHDSFKLQENKERTAEEAKVNPEEGVFYEEKIFKNEGLQVEHGDRDQLPGELTGNEGENPELPRIEENSGKESEAKEMTADEIRKSGQFAAHEINAPLHYNVDKEEMILRNSGELKVGSEKKILSSGVIPRGSSEGIVEGTDTVRSSQDNIFEKDFNEGTIQVPNFDSKANMNFEGKAEGNIGTKATKVDKEEENALPKQASFKTSGGNENNSEKVLKEEGSGNFNSSFILNASKDTNAEKEYFRTSFDEKRSHKEILSSGNNIQMIDYVPDSTKMEREEIMEIHKPKEGDVVQNNVARQIDIDSPELSIIHETNDENKSNTLHSGLQQPFSDKDFNGLEKVEKFAKSEAELDNLEKSTKKQESERSPLSAKAIIIKKGSKPSIIEEENAVSPYSRDNNKDPASMIINEDYAFNKPIKPNRYRASSPAIEAQNVRRISEPLKMGEKASEINRHKSEFKPVGGKGVSSDGLGKELPYKSMEKHNYEGSAVSGQKKALKEKRMSDNREIIPHSENKRHKSELDPVNSEFQIESHKTGVVPSVIEEEEYDQKPISEGRKDSEPSMLEEAPNPEITPFIKTDDSLKNPNNRFPYKSSSLRRNSQNTDKKKETSANQLRHKSEMLTLEQISPIRRISSKHKDEKAVGPINEEPKFVGNKETKKVSLVSAFVEVDINPVVQTDTPVDVLDIMENRGNIQSSGNSQEEILKNSFGKPVMQSKLNPEKKFISQSLHVTKQSNQIEKGLFKRKTSMDSNIASLPQNKLIVFNSEKIASSNEDKRRLTSMENDLGLHSNLEYKSLIQKANDTPSPSKNVSEQQCYSFRRKSEKANTVLYDSDIGVEKSIEEPMKVLTYEIFDESSNSSQQQVEAMRRTHDIKATKWRELSEKANDNPIHTEYSREEIEIVANKDKKAIEVDNSAGEEADESRTKEEDFGLVKCSHEFETRRKSNFSQKQSISNPNNESSENSALIAAYLHNKYEELITQNAVVRNSLQEREFLVTDYLKGQYEKLVLEIILDEQATKELNLNPSNELREAVECIRQSVEQLVEVLHALDEQVKPHLSESPKSNNDLQKRASLISTHEKIGSRRDSENRTSVRNSEKFEPVPVNESVTLIERNKKSITDIKSSGVIAIRQSKTGSVRMGSVEASLERIGIVQSYLEKKYEDLLRQSQIAKQSLEERDFLVKEYLSHVTQKLIVAMETEGISVEALASCIEKQPESNQQRESLEKTLSRKASAKDQSEITIIEEKPTEKLSDSQERVSMVQEFLNVKYLNLLDKYFEEEVLRDIKPETVPQINNDENSKGTFTLVKRADQYYELFMDDPCFPIINANQKRGSEHFNDVYIGYQAPVPFVNKKTPITIVVQPAPMQEIAADENALDLVNDNPEPTLADNNSEEKCSLTENSNAVHDEGEPERDYKSDPPLENVAFQGEGVIVNEPNDKAENILPTEVEHEDKALLQSTEKKMIDVEEYAKNSEEIPTGVDILQEGQGRDLTVRDSNEKVEVEKKINDPCDREKADEEKVKVEGIESVLFEETNYSSDQIKASEPKNEEKECHVEPNTEHGQDFAFQAVENPEGDWETTYIDEVAKAYLADKYNLLIEMFHEGEDLKSGKHLNSNELKSDNSKDQMTTNAILVGVLEPEEIKESEQSQLAEKVFQNQDVDKEVIFDCNQEKKDFDPPVNNEMVERGQSFQLDEYKENTSPSNNQVYESENPEKESLVEYENNNGNTSLCQVDNIDERNSFEKKLEDPDADKDKEIPGEKGSEAKSVKNLRYHRNLTTETNERDEASLHGQANRLDTHEEFSNDHNNNQDVRNYSPQKNFEDKESESDWKKISVKNSLETVSAARANTTSLLEKKPEGQGIQGEEFLPSTQILKKHPKYLDKVSKTKKNDKMLESTFSETEEKKFLADENSNIQDKSFDVPSLGKSLVKEPSPFKRKVRLNKSLDITAKDSKNLPEEGIPNQKASNRLGKVLVLRSDSYKGGYLKPLELDFTKKRREMTRNSSEDPKRIVQPMPEEVVENTVDKTVDRAELGKKSSLGMKKNVNKNFGELKRSVTDKSKHSEDVLNSERKSVRELKEDEKQKAFLKTIEKNPKPQNNAVVKKSLEQEKPSSKRNSVKKDDEGSVKKEEEGFFPIIVAVPEKQPSLSDVMEKRRSLSDFNDKRNSLNQVKLASSEKLPPEENQIETYSPVNRADSLSKEDLTKIEDAEKLPFIRKDSGLSSRSLKKRSDSLAEQLPIVKKESLAAKDEQNELGSQSIRRASKKSDAGNELVDTEQLPIIKRDSMGKEQLTKNTVGNIDIERQSSSKRGSLNKEPSSRRESTSLKELRKSREEANLASGSNKNAEAMVNNEESKFNEKEVKEANKKQEIKINRPEKAINLQRELESTPPLKKQEVSDINKIAQNNKNRTFEAFKESRERFEKLFIPQDLSIGPPSMLKNKNKSSYGSVQEIKGGGGSNLGNYKSKTYSGKTEKLENPKIRSSEEEKPRQAVVREGTPESFLNVNKNAPLEDINVKKSTESDVKLSIEKSEGKNVRQSLQEPIILGYKSSKFESKNEISPQTSFKLNSDGENKIKPVEVIRNEEKNEGLNLVKDEMPPEKPAEERTDLIAELERRTSAIRTKAKKPSRFVSEGGRGDTLNKESKEDDN